MLLGNVFTVLLRSDRIFNIDRPLILSGISESTQFSKRNSSRERQASNKMINFDLSIPPLKSWRRNFLRDVKQLSSFISKPVRGWPRCNSSSLLNCPIGNFNVLILVWIKDNLVISSDDQENSSREEQPIRMRVLRDLEWLTPWRFFISAQEYKFKEASLGRENRDGWTLHN